MDSSSEEDLTPKRAPRRRVSSNAPRAPRKIAEKTAPRKRVISRIVTDRDGLQKSEERISPISDRKAPTPLAEGQAVQQRRKKQTIVIVLTVVLGIGISALVGYTDNGQIDVQKTIEDRNERIRTNNPNEHDVMTSTLEVPVQNTNNAGKADGGFIGQGAPASTPQPVVASSTATSSDQTASSTETVASSTESGAEAVTEPEGTEEASTDL